MQRFRTKLTPGRKAPYTTWTFVVLPEVPSIWGSGPYEVRGTLTVPGGTVIPFRGTVSKGEGVYRMPVTQALLDQAGLSRGDPVEVAIELDPDPRPIDLPDELRAMFNEDPELAALFEDLPPSMRRAWASHIADAKRPETRLRRAHRASAGIRDRAFPR